MYPEFLISPMRDELTRHGVQELRSAADVDDALMNTPGTVMVVVNVGSADSGYFMMTPQLGTLNVATNRFMVARPPSPRRERVLVVRVPGKAPGRHRCCSTDRSGRRRFAIVAPLSYPDCVKTSVSRGRPSGLVGSRPSSVIRLHSGSGTIPCPSRSLAIVRAIRLCLAMRRLTQAL